MADNNYKAVNEINVIFERVVEIQGKLHIALKERRYAEAVWLCEKIINLCQKALGICEEYFSKPEEFTDYEFILSSHMMAQVQKVELLDVLSKKK